MKKELPLAISALVLALAVPALAARTTSVWETVSGGGVGMIPYVWSDKNNLYIDFESKNFDNIEYVYYDLLYDTNEEARSKRLQDSFVPTITTPDGEYEGVPYYRRHLPLGTRSGSTWVYHKDPRNVKLTVNTNMIIGRIDQYTAVYRFPDDQFTF